MVAPLVSSNSSYIETVTIISQMEAKREQSQLQKARKHEPTTIRNKRDKKIKALLCCD